MPQLLLGDLDLLADPYMALLGSTWGDWQAITTAVDSLFLDGSIISGDRSGNRAISLQVMVTGTSRPALVAASEALFAAANQEATTLTFVPDDGAAVVYDVFRAQPQRTDDQTELWEFRTYTFTFPALPFARSDTRSTSGALAPAVALASFESATTGVLLGTPSGGEFLMPYDGTVPEASWVQVARPPSLSADTNCTVANGQATTPAGGLFACAVVTPTAAGLVEFHVTASAACSASQVVAGVDLVPYWTSGSRYGAQEFQAGVEWLDASNATVRIDWGPAQGMSYSSGGPGQFDAWVISARPSTATKVRTRVRVPSALVGEKYVVFKNATIPVTPGTIPTQSAVVHDGTKAPALPSGPQYKNTGYLSVTLAAPTNVSAKPKLQTWVSLNDPTYGYPERPALSLRLTDSSGRWSRFDAPVAVPPFTGVAWWPTTWALSAPSQSSSTGAADLTAVASVDLFSASKGPGTYLDQIAAVDEPSATTSPRGTVFDLSISGSARSAARVVLSATGKLSDLLVATTNQGELPMLPVASNVATCPAPGGYDGVYGVLGSVAPATALTTPTCVVTQLIGGVSVATQTLTGVQQTGNRYVDFGSVALPLVAMPDENAGVSYTFALSPSSTAWGDVLLINADASLVWAPNLTTARTYAFIDEPLPPAQLGRLFIGDASDRTDARALLNAPIMARPFQVSGPGIRVLVYGSGGAPSVSFDYFPHWLVEPL